MTPPKNTPASEAGAEDKNKAISNENYIGTAQKLLQAFSKDAKYFCGFTDKKLPIGKGLQPNQTKYGIKLSELNPAELWSIEEIRSFKQLPFNFLGLPLNKKDGSKVVCLDFDGKNASDSSLFASYRNFAEKQGYLVETSLSGKGFHVFFKTDAEMPSEKWCFSDGLELEFFPHQSAKAILLTGKDLKGELKHVENPILELKQQGLHEPTQISTENTLKPRVSVFSEDDVDRIALSPENMASWVPAVFPSARCTPDGRWRVSSADLGRDLEEDLSISENGIKDFGLHDLPDQFKKGKFTPTQLVAEWKFGGDKYWKDSRDWLREVCGMNAFSKADPISKTFASEVSLDDLKPEPIDWLIANIFPEGLGVISGAPASGKSTALIPCAFSCTGLLDLPVVVKRKVVYFTEDIPQLKRSLIGIRQKYKLNNKQIAEWFRVYPAQRLEAKQLKQRLAEVIKRHTIIHDTGECVTPLVVLDTSSANLGLDDENSSAQVGEHLSSFKELMYEMDCSIWVITHLAKSAKGLFIDELANFSARGSSNYEGDSSWTALVGRVSEGSNETVVQIDKERTCGVIAGLRISCRVEFHSAIGINRRGESEEVPYPVVSISTASKTEHKKMNYESVLADAFEKIKDAIENPPTDDGYLMMVDVREILGGKKETQTKIIKALQGKKWIAKKVIPKDERSNPQRKESFILGEEAKNASF